MDKGHRYELRHTDDHGKPEQLTGRKPGAEESVQDRGRKEAGIENCGEFGIHGVGSVEPIGEEELHRCVGAGSEEPEHGYEDDWVNSAMLDQPLYIAKETGASGMRVLIGMPENGARLPESKDTKYGR